MCTKAELKKITISIIDEAYRIFENKLVRIILYGSYARGDNSVESDIDFFLLLNMDSKELGTYHDAIAKVSSRLSLESEDCVTISIALQDNITYEKYKTILPFYRNINDEGVIIYAA